MIRNARAFLRRFPDARISVTGGTDIAGGSTAGGGRGGGGGGANRVQLLVPGAGGRPAKVSDIASLSLEPGPANIDRYNRQRQVSLMAGLDGIPLQTAINEVQKKIDEMNFKPGYSAVFGFGARIPSQASSDFQMAIILAIIFIYMVLASQFNSLIHPLTIMTAIPLSLPCGLFALMLFGMTLNVYSAIGLMMLFGIVKKNSILQVDYTNTLISQGVERDEAIIAANHVRLRPILMTTIAIVAGMLPIALDAAPARDPGHPWQ